MPTFSNALLAIAVTVAATGAQAVTVLNDSIIQNGNISALNYAAFSNFNVTGAVDLVRSGDFGITCAPGSGVQCVDLAGSPGPGQLTSKASYGIGNVDLVTLTFDVSGPQRGVASGGFFAGFIFGSDTTVTDFTVNGVNLGDASSVGNRITFNGTATGDAFTSYAISFRSLSSNGVQVFIGTGDPGSVGPILDNVRLDITGVPEAATWTTMIAGFGLVGFAARRRRVLAAA